MPAPPSRRRLNGVPPTGCPLTPSIRSSSHLVVADTLRFSDDEGQTEVIMTTHRDARLEMLLSAICALAGSLPPEVRQRAGAALGERVAGLCLSDEASDTAAARDLALILGNLGCMPSVDLPDAGTHGAPYW